MKYTDKENEEARKRLDAPYEYRKEIEKFLCWRRLHEYDKRSYLTKELVEEWHQPEEEKTQLAERSL